VGKCLENLPPRWRVEKNVFDLDGRAEGACGGSKLVSLAAVNTETVPHWSLCRTRDDLHLGHRTDARQGLAAKSQRRDAKQIGVGFSLLVAWRSTARVKSSGAIPSPLSDTWINDVPLFS